MQYLENDASVKDKGRRSSSDIHSRDDYFIGGGPKRFTSSSEETSRRSGTLRAQTRAAT